MLELILDDSHEYGIETSNVVIFAIQIALGELLKHHGAKPAAVVGQSLGEPASAYFARRAVAARRRPRDRLALAPDG